MRFPRVVTAASTAIIFALAGATAWAQSGGEADSPEDRVEKESAKSAELPSIDEVIEKLDTLYRSTSSHAVMKMEVKKPRGSRTLKLESWSKGEERMLIVIREPAREAGTATLRTPEGLWNYLPRADRLMRIPSGLLSDEWMGSHFSNDDLVRETSYDDDYDGSVEAAELDGRKTLKVTLTPKPDAPVVYSKLVFHVTRDDWVPLEQKFYDDGDVVRTMVFSNVETVDDRDLPMRMTLRPKEEADEFTRIEYEELEFGVDVDDRLFSKRGLRRRAK